MSHDHVVLARVGQIRGRIRLLLAQQWICVGLTWALLAGLLLVLATKLQWWRDAIDYLWVLAMAGVLAGLVFSFTRRVTPHAAARVADERGGLKERLSTALEVSGRDGREEVDRAQLADAARYAASLRAGEVLPWRMPRQWRWLAGAAVLLLAAIYVPELPVFHSAQERVDRDVMRAEGKRIQAVAKTLAKRAETEKRDEKNAEILKRIAQNMKALGRDQERGRIGKKQALLKMNDLQEQLKEAQAKLGPGAGEKSLQQAAAEMQAAARAQDRQGAQQNAQQLQQMARSLQNRDFDGAAKQLQELGKKLQEGKLSAEDAARAADMLEKMAEGMDRSTLQQAGKELQQAAQELAKAADAAKQLQQQLAQAKTDAERRELQQQVAQALQQAAQQAGQKTQKAGGT